MEKTNLYQLVVPFIIFILALILLYKLIQPTIIILLGGVLIAYLSFPLYKRIAKKISHKSIAIMLSLLIIVIIIAIPFVFLTFEVTQEGYNLFDSLSDSAPKGKLFGVGCISAESKVCAILNRVERFSADRLSAYGLDKELQKLIPIVGKEVTAFILSIPLLIAEFFLSVILAYFIIKDWESILKQIVFLLPMRTKTTNKLVKQFGEITHTVIYAQLFVACIQGLIGTIGYFIFGVPFPIILGVMTAFGALIPNVGTAIIWIPAALYLILSGHFSHNYWILVKGVGLFLYGLFIISTIDNFLLAKIVHTRTKVSQILIIIGVIGGAAMFGIIGIFVGPILLPLLITYFETFKERFR